MTDGQVIRFVLVPAAMGVPAEHIRWSPRWLGRLLAGGVKPRSDALGARV